MCNLIEKDVRLIEEAWLWYTTAIIPFAEVSHTHAERSSSLSRPTGPRFASGGRVLGKVAVECLDPLANYLGINAPNSDAAQCARRGPARQYRSRSGMVLLVKSGEYDHRPDGLCAFTVCCSLVPRQCRTRRRRALPSRLPGTLCRLSDGVS